MSEHGRMVRGPDGRWIYLTHDELMEASDRRWSAIVAASAADDERTAAAESQVAALVSGIEAYVDERRRLFGATKSQRNGKAKG